MEQSGIKVDRPAAGMSQPKLPERKETTLFVTKVPPARTPFKRYPSRVLGVSPGSSSRLLLASVPWPSPGLSLAAFARGSDGYTGVDQP